MGEFAPVLRDLRHSAGLTQEGLIEALDGEFARSTLANIEAGREVPSVRFFRAVSGRFPEWRSSLSEPFGHAREQVGRRSRTGRDPQRTVLGPLGGRAVVEHLCSTYVFDDGPGPVEVVETRRIRAASSGVTGYVARFITGPGFEAEHDVTGGELRAIDRVADRVGTTVLCHIAFESPLLRGETHELTTRSVVRGGHHDAATTALLVPDTTTGDAEVRLRFGGRLPDAVDAFGPVADRSLLDAPQELVRFRPLDVADVVTTRFADPAVGLVYGVRWTW
ncbi:helix-turn-helix transcriptional regulator [Nocardioides ultimimeridianus]